MPNKKHILIVEDSESIMSFLEIILKSEGYSAHKASNATDGLNILQKKKIDLITLDLGLPDMDGTEMLEKIRDISPYKPVIVLSVRNNSITKKIAATLGVKHYITKPFEADEILEAVATELA